MTGFWEWQKREVKLKKFAREIHEKDEKRIIDFSVLFRFFRVFRRQKNYFLALPRKYFPIP